jgi:hypothetical protein
MTVIMKNQSWGCQPPIGVETLGGKEKAGWFIINGVSI